jgi:cytochrome P450
VLVSPYLLHRDPGRWPAPAAFRPERWEALGGARAALSGLGPNGAYAPFGAGPRNCIGTGAPDAWAAEGRPSVNHAAQ